VVAAGLAKRCTIQLSYAIGIAEPLSLYVDLHGTETDGVTAAKLEEVLPTLVRLTPKGIRTHLGLNKPIYGPTATYGHFGRKAEGDRFTWEKTDLVDRLKAAF
jgi:S-adenosylmethionine synthetase